MALAAKAMAPKMASNTPISRPLAALAELVAELLADLSASEADARGEDMLTIASVTIAKFSRFRASPHCARATPSDATSFLRRRAVLKLNSPGHG